MLPASLPRSVLAAQDITAAWNQPSGAIRVGSVPGCNAIRVALVREVALLRFDESALPMPAGRSGSERRPHLPLEGKDVLQGKQPGGLGVPARDRLEQPAVLADRIAHRRQPI